MCGICGVYNYLGKSIDEKKLKHMCDLIRHRGPDDEGYYISEKLKVEWKNSVNVGLGMRRLAIIDLQTGHQPIHNEDKSLVIVFNGEIYNFLSLKEELEKKGHKFYTKTDTEVVVHLYEEYKEQSVNYLRGMFAFAIFDQKEKRLFIARDRVGKKPLYYTIYNGNFIFSSEIKSVVSYLDKEPEINLDAIDNFLTYQYIPQPMTIYKNIFSLLPANILICNKDGAIKIEEYWNLNFKEKLKINFYEACEEIKNILEESTRIRLISDVPLGAFLSGGHDSSIVVGLMSKNSSNAIKTFSVGFNDYKTDISNELKYAKIVSKHFGTQHTEIFVEPKMTEILPKLIWYYDQPFADTSIIPSYYISRVTRKYVKVALNGDGGDENFCGYLRYKALKLSTFFLFNLFENKFYSKLSGMIPNIRTKYFKKIKYLKRFLSVLGNNIFTRNVLWHAYFSNEEKNFIYSDFMKSQIKNNSYDYMINIYNTSMAEDFIDKILYTDIKSYLPGDLLVKMDIASMANSLESRSPFLDHKLLEFTAKIPSNWKLKGLETKYILKEAYKNFLPKKIVNRSKQGFGLPIDSWFRNELKSYVKEILTSRSALSRNYFNSKNIEILLEQHFQSKNDHGYKIFALLILELWHQIFVDKSF